MAPVPLNIAPVFRPWRQAGITCLLLDEATAVQLKQAAVLAHGEPSIGQPQPQQSIPRKWQEPACRYPAGKPALQKKLDRSEHPVSQTIQKASSPRQSWQAPEKRKEESGALAKESAGNLSAQRGEQPHVSASPENSGTGSSYPVVPRRLPPEQWPTYWRSLLERTPRSPEVVWTYPSLSRDLGGAADATHRDFLRRLLGDMGMPRGTNAFWPLNVYPYPPDGGENTVEASMFMSGIDILNPDMIILMCGRAPVELGLKGLGLLIPTIIRGRRFVITPHVDELILQPRRYMQLVTFLKSQLGGR